MLQTLKSLTRSEFTDTNFITGLRAYAAIMVILIHAGGAGLRDFGDIGNRIADIGATGVYIFFVISGFCIANSFAHNPNKKIFWSKRFWRVAPLYFATSFLGLALLLAGNPISDWRHLLGEQTIAYETLMHFTFLSAWDYRVTNSFIGVEWSIPIEMFWYCVLPFLFPFLKNWKGVAVLFVITCAILSMKFLYSAMLPPEASAMAIKWSPVRYAPAFFLGMLAFKLRPYIANLFSLKLLDIGLFLVITIALIELIFLQIGNQYLNVIVLSFLIIVLGGHGKISRILFETKPVLFWGAISYSLYLTHMFVLAFTPDIFENSALIKFIYTMLVTTAMSTLTYLFIEKRGIKFAKQIKQKTS